MSPKAIGFEFHQLDIRGIVTAPREAELALHAVKDWVKHTDENGQLFWFNYKTQEWKWANSDRSFETAIKKVEAAADNAAEAAFWRYALLTYRVDRFYSRALICASQEIGIDDAVEFRLKGNSQWQKGIVVAMPNNIERQISGYDANKSAISVSNNQSIESSSSMPPSYISKSISSNDQIDNILGGSRERYKVKDRYNSVLHQTHTVESEDIRRDVGFFVNKIPRRGPWRCGLAYLSNFLCHGNTGEPRIISVQTSSIRKRGAEDQQPAILCYRPNVDLEKTRNMRKGFLSPE